MGRDVRLDTVNDFLLINRDDVDLFSDGHAYRYLRTYLSGDSGFEDIDDRERTQFTERVLIYQSTRSITKFLLESPLEPLYQAIANGFKRIGNYTTLNLVKSSDGSLGLKQGEANDGNLLQFKVHASVNDGIEPRVTLKDLLSLRYDPVHQDALLEIRHDF